jgi:hypothetical protein
MWFDGFDERLELEKQAVASLLAEGLVQRVVWHVDEHEGTVSADVDFEAGGQLREAKLVYPFVYPYVPLQVRPRQDGERWSGHQWQTGELCLEMRADNWHPDFNARDMLFSARRLLDTEATLDDAGAALQVPADHQFTEGQLLSGHFLRLVISDDMIEEVRRRGAGAHLLDLTTAEYDSSWVFTAVSLVACADHVGWIDAGVPPRSSSKVNHVGRVADIEEGDARHRALIDRNCPPAQIWAQFSPIPFDGNGLVVGLLNDRVLAKWLLSDKAYDIVEVPMDNQQRSPTRNDAVAGKRIAIVGCGSMGSKVAASLVRCGISSFLLVDGDVLKAGNLVRNDLDWSAVGAHKVDGVINRLRLIRPDVQVDRWIGRLGGQHSTSSLVSCLTKLGQCDLIVECTGSGQGFSIAAAVATQEKVPMVWGRVFGGGYGGYVVRCRPGIEAPPLDVRHQIYTFMTDPSLPKPPDESDIDYGSEADEQGTMIADDADVSVISAHLARMSLDTLRPSEESDYPYSAYLIGLRKEWIFQAPFETRPLVLHKVSPVPPREESALPVKHEPSMSTVAEGTPSRTVA